MLSVMGRRRAENFIWVILLASLWCVGATIRPVFAEVAVPPLQQRVTDLTGTLTDTERQDLENRLAHLETQKGSQMAILIVPTTRPETIEQYGIRVVDQWKLGRKGVDDGLLILVAKDDREFRIEVGYGLEGVIPDAIAKRVTDEIMLPYFRDGNFYGGLRAGTAQLAKLIEGEPLPPPKQPRTNGEGFGVGMLALLVIVFGLGAVLRMIFGRFLGALIGGGGAGAWVWLAAGSIAGAVFAAIIAFVIVLVGGAFMGGNRMYRGGGFGGGIGGGGFGGGGFGGGGFGGGGGGFGGGGASGRW